MRPGPQHRHGRRDVAGAVGGIRKPAVDHRDRPGARLGPDRLPGVVTQLDFWSARDGLAATYRPDAAAPWQLWITPDDGSTWLVLGNATWHTADGGRTWTRA